MSRITPALTSLLFALPGLGCSPNQPESSGTNTNWLVACDSDDQCIPTASCICGVCTRSCASDADCSPGVCGSELATVFQCGGPPTQPICLPARTDGAACWSFPIPNDPDLALTATTPCSQPGALLCESFDAPLPTEYGTFNSGAMIASVEDCLVHQGAGALRYQASASGYSQTRMRLASVVSSGFLAARFYVYVPSEVTISNFLAMLELWSNDVTSDDKVSLEVKPDDVLEIYLTPNGTAHRSAAGALRRDRWSCITLTMNVAAENGTMSLSVDGATVIDAASVVTLPPNGISVAVVEGFPSRDESGAELLIDELVVATEPLSCP